MERVNGIAPLSRPWHGRILLLNHTRLEFWIFDLRFTRLKNNGAGFDTGRIRQSQIINRKLRNPWPVSFTG